MFGMFKRNKDAYTPKVRDQFAASHGVRLATYPETFGPYAELRERVAGLAQQGRLEEFDAIYRTAVENRDVMPNGRLLSSVLASWAVADRVPGQLDLMPQYLEPFARRFTEAPSPVTGALYSEALLHLAGLERGAAWGHETDPSQWAGYTAALGTAHAVLESANPSDQDDYLWLAAASELAPHTGAGIELRDDLFERAWRQDRMNILLIGGQMQDRLPRWSGRDGSYADEFARRAMQLTAADLGAGGYTLAYAYWAKYPSNPQVGVEEAELDINLMRQGCIDLMQRFPASIIIRNELACTMSWIGAEDLVRNLFDDGLRLIDPVSWGGGTPEDSLERAVRAFLYARDSA